MEVRILGPVELVGADGPVRLAAMPRRLLAALVLEPGQSRTIDVLIEALCGERPPRDAAEVLQQSRLRKTLPEGTRIRTDSSGYALELDEGAGRRGVRAAARRRAHAVLPEHRRTSRARAGTSRRLLAGVASVLSERELDDDAATIWGAVCAAEERLGFRMLAGERRRYERRLARLENTPAWLAGKTLKLEEAAASIPTS